MAGDPWGYGAQSGYYTDTETGLVLCTHRFYDPGTGRFLTRDPIGYGGGVNLYGYTANNPVNGIDPDGTTVDDVYKFGKLVALLPGLINHFGGILGNVVKGVQPEPQNIERTLEPEASKNPVAENAEADEIGEFKNLRMLRGAGEEVENFLESEATTAEGGQAVATEGAEVAGGIGALPIIVITAGVVAVADLVHYGVTGKANGPFTSIGKWIGDKFLPGSDGLSAPPGSVPKCHNQ